MAGRILCGSDAADVAINGDPLPVREHPGRATGAHESRDAVLTGDNRGVRADPTRVDHYRDRPLEQRRPSWVRVGTDQYVTAAHRAELRRLSDDPCWPGRPAVARRHAAHQGALAFSSRIEQVSGSDH